MNPVTEGRIDPPRVIYITGIDGSGKSTVSEHLAARLREAGYEVDILWLRFNHVISKPLLGLCRVLGLTRYEVRDGIRVGYHDFYRSKIVSWLFIFSQYLDALRVRYLKLGPRLAGDGKVIILDRYVYDILIDVMTDTRINDLHRGRVGRAFKRLLPQGVVTILVNRDLERVLEVRPEGRVDDNFLRRYEFYKELAEDPSVNTIHNDSSLDSLLDAAEYIAGIRQ